MLPRRGLRGQHRALGESLLYKKARKSIHLRELGFFLCELCVKAFSFSCFREKGTRGCPGSSPGMTGKGGKVRKIAVGGGRCRAPSPSGGPAASSFRSC